MTAEEIKIRAQPQTYPNKCDFLLENTVALAGAFPFTKTQSSTSPIATELFKLGYIDHVLVVGQTITVTKSSDKPWQEIGKEIGAAIRRAFTSGAAVISENEKQRSEPEQQLMRKVIDIIQNVVNPAIASHGGFIDLIDVRDKDLYIRMGGGCQGCASSAATLKQGVENSFREHLPELGTVHDTTDHAAGQNPYFK